MVAVAWCSSSRRTEPRRCSISSQAKTEMGEVRLQAWSRTAWEISMVPRHGGATGMVTARCSRSRRTEPKPLFIPSTVRMATVLTAASWQMEREIFMVLPRLVAPITTVPCSRSRRDGSNTLNGCRPAPLPSYWAQRFPNETPSHQSDCDWFRGVGGFGTARHGGNGNRALQLSEFRDGGAPRNSAFQERIAVWNRFGRRKICRRTGLQTDKLKRCLEGNHAADIRWQQWLDAVYGTNARSGRSLLRHDLWRL